MVIERGFAWQLKLYLIRISLPCNDIEVLSQLTDIFMLLFPESVSNNLGRKYTQQSLDSFCILGAGIYSALWNYLILLILWLVACASWWYAICDYNRLCLFWKKMKTITVWINYFSGQISNVCLAMFLLTIQCSLIGLIPQKTILLLFLKRGMQQIESSVV